MATLPGLRRDGVSRETIPILCRGHDAPRGYDADLIWFHGWLCFTITAILPLYVGCFRMDIATL